MTIIAPWRIWNIKSRDEEIDYAEAHNIPLKITRETSYSKDKNLWHLSHEGLDLEDPANEPKYDDILEMGVSPEKAPDVPTYVEYGAADIGIVGKDTILEEGRRLYEVLDLGYGKCRMCVCGPESARELLQHNQQIRVATKYPNIAKDYFYNRKHQTVEMIKLNGSIELAPIVGLSEVIVDIVETGSTLRENGLTVLEEVCPLSARMVVNQVSMRMENERITKLIQDLKGALV